MGVPGRAPRPRMSGRHLPAPRAQPASRSPEPPPQPPAHPSFPAARPGKITGRPGGHTGMHARLRGGRQTGQSGSRTARAPQPLTRMSVGTSSLSMISVSRGTTRSRTHARVARRISAKSSAETCAGAACSADVLTALPQRRPQGPGRRRCTSSQGRNGRRRDAATRGPSWRGYGCRSRPPGGPERCRTRAR